MEIIVILAAAVAAVWYWRTQMNKPQSQPELQQPETVAPYKIETPPVLETSQTAPVSDHVRVESTAPTKTRTVTKKPAAGKTPTKAPVTRKAKTPKK